MNSYQHMEAGNIPNRPNLEAVCNALNVPESRLFLDPDLVPRPSPAVAIEVLADSLAAQAQKIRELEAEANEYRSLSPDARELLHILASVDDPKVVSDVLLWLKSLAVRAKVAETALPQKIRVKR